MSTIHKRRNGRPLASVSNNQAIRSPHGAIDIVGEVGGVMDGGEHTGLHLFLFHILPGQQKNIEGGGGHHSYNILLLTWVLQADLHILCQKTNEPLSLHFHTEEEKIVWKFQFLNSISTNVNGKEHKCLNFDQLTLVVFVWRKEVTSGEIVTTPRFPRAQPLAAFLSWRTNIFVFWFYFALKFLFSDSRSVF